MVLFLLPLKLGGWLLYLGDSLEVMRTMPDSSIDACITDPPYGLSFMGKKWDYDVPSVEIWREVFRVLKPGGHLLAFGGTRTYHRLAVNVEDAGFEIRDQIQWLYGQGFPKSLDVSKAIDKAAGAHVEKGDKFNVVGGTDASNGGSKFRSDHPEYVKRTPETPDAKQWEGWGTALKPANEPIVLARKPLEKGLTVAQNVQKWGTGAINVDASRIPSEVIRTTQGGVKASGGILGTKGEQRSTQFENTKGRFPSNVLLDDRAAELLDEQTGELKSGDLKPYKRANRGGWSGDTQETSAFEKSGDSGGASRFFMRFQYCAKSSQSERNAGLDRYDPIWEQSVWDGRDLSSLTENISQLAKDISDDILVAGLSWNIDGFGNNTTDQSQTVLTCIIQTTLKLITESKTWNCSQNSSTKESIRVAIRTLKANGLNPAESAGHISQLRASITNEKTALALGAVHAALLTLQKISGYAKFGAFHPTIKPIRLCEYLCRLITAPGGKILDPFMGSGTAGIAAKRLGFEFIGIELNPEYFEIATRRIENAKPDEVTPDPQLTISEATHA